VQDLVVVLIEVIKLTGVWRIGRDGIELTPIAASVLIKVRAWIGGRIHQGLIETRNKRIFFWDRILGRPIR